MSSPSPRLLLVALPLAASLAACGDYSLYGSPDHGVGLTAMTQDLGMGGDLQAVLAAAPADQAARADALWAQKDASSFATRVEAIADGIKLRVPDVVGVQSAMQWRVTPSGAAAPQLASDYLDELLAALAARGLSYAAVATVTTADLSLTGAAGDVYRVTDREAILVRAGIASLESTSGAFVAQRMVSIGGTAVPYARGWVAIQLQIAGKSFRVVSTHLDSIDPTTQRAQATELLAVASPSHGPTLMMGNIGADVADRAWAAYSITTSSAAGFSDAVAVAGAAFPTCCRDAACIDPAAKLDRRNDVILATPEFQPWTGVTVNGATSPMVDGLWPSPHAGVVASMALIPPQ